MFPKDEDPGRAFEGLRPPLVTSEILPPREGDPRGFLARARQLSGAGVELVFLPDAPQGIPRAAGIPAAAALARAAGLRAVPHVNCRDRNRIALEGVIAGAALAELPAIKAVTGDAVPPAQGQGVYEIGSVELVELVTAWNRGPGKDGKRYLTAVVGHTLGETRPEAAEERLARKLRAGASVVVTTPTLDPERLVAFLDRVAGRRPRVLAGLTLLPGRQIVEYLGDEVATFGVPDGVKERLRAARSPAELERAGLEAALDVAGAVRDRVAGFHVVPPFGHVEAVLPLVNALREDRLG